MQVEIPAHSYAHLQRIMRSIFGQAVAGGVSRQKRIMRGKRPVSGSQKMKPIEIVPAILVHSFEEYKRRLLLVEGLVKTIQLDVMDGKFVPNTTFADPKQIQEVHADLVIEAHLMVEDPRDWVERYKEGPVKRLIFHVESVKHPAGLIALIKEAGFEVGITLNPTTPIWPVWDYLSSVDLFQVMAVHPGFGGQGFQEVAFSKIREARRAFPNLDISVDGGVHESTAKKIVQAGANILCAGSHIFEEGQDIGGAIEELRKAAQGLG